MADTESGGTESTYVWVSIGERVEATTLRSSPQGLTVLLTAKAALEVGFQVRVETSSGRRTAQIASVEETTLGQQVDLTWAD